MPKSHGSTSMRFGRVDTTCITTTPLDFKVIIRMGERFGVTLNMATDELLV